MKNAAMTATILLSVLLVARPGYGATVEAKASTPVPIGVLGLTSEEEPLKEMAGKINALFPSLLSAQPGVLLVERAELDKALSELELGISGTVDPASAAKIGSLTGAKVLVNGRIFSMNGEVYVTAKIVGTETGRLFAETEHSSLENSPAEAVTALAKKVAKTVAAHEQDLLSPAGKADSLEDVVARLRKLVAGKQLPSVSVSIKESSLGRGSLDPAAEVELSRILQSLGFELVDPKRNSAQIEITGEAFSEFGMRKANLVSSKARVELRVIERASGKILLIDRETQTAVDLSQEIAGKEALSKATRILAERLVPKVV